jgi:hypothetical protein
MAWNRIGYALAFVLMFSVTAGAVPSRLSYQGKLSDASGAPLSGPHTFYFGLYQGGSASVANDGLKAFEESAVVTAVAGVVNHSVGSGLNSFGGPLSAGMFATTLPVYLQVAIDTPANVVLPRTRIESVPYALIAGNSGAPGLGIWASRATMPGARKEMACASLRGLLYAIGGRTNNNEPFGTVSVWNPATNTWVSTSSQTVPRYKLAAATVNDVMYAIGGLNTSGIASTTVEVFNADTGTWSVGTALPLAAGPAACALLNGKIYVFSPTNTQIYDPGSNIWSVGAPMPASPASGFAAAAAGGRVYIFALDTGTLEYNPQGNTWTDKGGYLRVGEWPCATSVNDMIWVFFRSGSAAGNVEATMAQYDAAQNAYLGPVSMISSRSASACTVLNGRIYVVGGYRFFATSQASDYNEEFTPPLY